ncbi:YdcF family protein [Phyllobacterium sp. 628]|uniref:YdcF family protein n=1 Tax=Phyllobacterium sp. 628 TaxID=2718938 RepID=UPI0016625F3D|nr:YdcF family protein [Phyllobacterium sp. 628]QND51247.1 YdcF family protein [Phyllobacterium sp. 628]
MRDTVAPAVERAARILWDFHLIYDELTPADLIIGLGSYDLRVADRCADLFHQALAPKILFTGKAGNWTSNLYQTSEAEAFAERAIAAGVPADAIIIEPEATNIGENIRFARAMADAAVRSVIIVTKPQTQRRAFATAKAQWPEINAAVTAPLHGFEEQPLTAYPLERLINEMVGDIQRIIDYPAKSFQIAQDIPASVRDAYRFLVSEGYDHHL